MELFKKRKLYYMSVDEYIVVAIGLYINTLKLEWLKSVI